MTTSTEYQGVTQVISGEGSRIAARDYIEKISAGSLRHYLATTPTAKQDLDTINSDWLFGYRFGLSAPDLVRADIIAIKRAYGMTDHEIRWLVKSGSIARTRFGARIAPTNWSLAIGLYFIAIMTAFCLSGSMVVLLSTAPPFIQLIASCTLSGILLGTYWLVDKLFFMPWRLCRLPAIVGVKAQKVD